jgi:hypothetical protein
MNKWVSDEILALRTMFEADDYYLPASHKQIHGFRNAVTKVVPEECRIPVMQLITGIHMKGKDGVSSTSTLTMHTYKVLIDEMMEKDDNGKIKSPWTVNERSRNFLLECKAAVEAGADEDPWDIDLGGL